MLGQVSGDKEEQLLEGNQRRNLPAVGSENARDDLDKMLLLQFSEDAERRRFGTPWFLTKGGYLRVTAAIVGPKRSCPKGEFPLGRWEAEDALQAIANLVISLKEELR